MNTVPPLDELIAKLDSEDASLPLKAAFSRLYQLLSEGRSGEISESQIRAVDELPDLEAMNLSVGPKLKRSLSQLAVIKLNGGLGTSMGLARAKSLLPAKEGNSFLALIAKQVLSLRDKQDCSIPLIFMNSFRTEVDSLAALKEYPQVLSGQSGIPLSFIQNRIPKLRKDNHRPVSWTANPDLEWCPPGHGDLYTAMFQSGLLSQLLERGYKYAFVSNADNLGATVSLKILDYFASSSAPFLMEVADRTSADKKGGHLARDLVSNSLVLREVAQCPEADLESFQDITKHRFFNTNSLWLNLEKVLFELEQHKGVLSLPLIVNQKLVDPKDLDSTPVIQLETAMGAAIEVFTDSLALRVPRSRFLPVKKTNDLLRLWSDIYSLEDSGEIKRNDNSIGRSVEIELDSRYFGTIEKFSDRFSFGAPSLTDCERLEVRGNVFFGKGVVCRGRVCLTNSSNEPLLVPDGDILTA